ncbi:MAG TPA: hypothetical protein VF581_01340 [Flavobacterium sp.]|jgi:hypothetical protein
MKKFAVALFLLAGSFASAQSINDYKYAIVPKKFDFLSEADKFNMNTLTKMFMEKYGFVTFFDTDTLPNDIVDRSCNRVYVDVINDKAVFLTKLTVVLKDCKNNILYSSRVGTSKEKSYKTAYVQALRGAFKSFDQLGYKYNGAVTEVQTSTIRTTNNGTTVTKEVIPPPQAGSKGDVIYGKPQQVKPEVVDTNNLLFAQPIENGFQIVDTTPKVVLKLQNTSAPGIYLAERDQLRGTLFAKDGKHVFEYYKDGRLVSEVLNIRF